VGSRFPAPIHHFSVRGRFNPIINTAFELTAAQFDQLIRKSAV
jgi:hypothetical protein